MTAWTYVPHNKAILQKPPGMQESPVAGRCSDKGDTLGCLSTSYSEVKQSVTLSTRCQLYVVW